MNRWITDWERGEPDWMPYYTRANAGETLPNPASPLKPSAGDRAAAS